MSPWTISYWTDLKANKQQKAAGDAGGLLCFLIYPLCVQLRCLLQKNSASTEVKIPHTQMAMELMAPWRADFQGLGGTHGVAAGAYGYPPPPGR